MELELKNVNLEAIQDNWYKLTIELNLKTIELYLKPRIEIKGDNPTTLMGQVADTLKELSTIDTSEYYDPGYHIDSTT